MKKAFWWALGFAWLGGAALWAQGDTAEEMVDLSPFEVTSVSEGYLASSVARTRVYGGDNAAQPNVAITVTKRADAVAVQFVLRNDSEKTEVRNRELLQTVTALETAAKEAGLTIEQREVRLTGGDRKVLSFGKGSTTSFVNLVVIAPLGADRRVADVVKAVRELVSEKRLVGRSRVADGTVGLILKDVAQYRQEILTKIFADLEFLRQKVGPDFEVQPHGFDQPVRLRPVGEGSLELWIDYGFNIQSIRVINQKK